MSDHPVEERQRWRDWLQGLQMRLRVRSGLAGANVKEIQKALMDMVSFVFPGQPASENVYLKMYIGKKNTTREEVVEGIKECSM